MKLLQLDMIRAARSDGPFTLVQDLVPDDVMTELIADYPPGLRPIERTSGSDKTYRMSVLPLVKLGRPQPELEGLSPRWQQFLTELQSSEYRACLEMLAGQKLEPDKLDISLFSFGPGDGISPHTDHVGKVVNHIFYLNRDWDASWGGRLVLLSSGQADARIAEISPNAERSVVIARSDRSWHMVESGTSLMPHPRRSLQVEFWGSA